MSGLLLGVAHPAVAEYAVTPFQLPFPGATEVTTWGINDQGQLVGSALLSGRERAFVYDSGLVNILPLPTGGSGSWGIGLSNNGVVVGNWWTTEDVYQPFVYSMNSRSYSLTSLELPNGQAPQARAISSDARYITGFYSKFSGNVAGFVWDMQNSQQVADIDPGAYHMITQGINSFGQVVGNYASSETGSQYAFLYDIRSGARSDFSFAGVDVLAPRAINDKGQIAGWMWSAESNVDVAWIGNASGYQVISAGPSKSTVGEGLNNLGEVVGFIDQETASGSFTTSGFIARPVALPVSSTGGAGGSGEPPSPYVYSFSAAVIADVPIFIDPLVAVGYKYSIGDGDPRFKSVSLPVGVGDNIFDVEVEGSHFTVLGNEVFDFTAHGFATGVETFTVTGIEPQALLDPANPLAFVTRLTFVADGMFTGTQTALTVDYTPPVPEPSTWGLMFAGLCAVGAVARRRRVQAAQA
jgi:hypothetical protein